MKRHDLLTVGVWALATMGVALTALSTLPVVAVDAKAPAKKIEVPVLKAGKVELSATFAKDDRVTFKDGAMFVAAGDLPAVELTARNTGDAEETVTFTIVGSEQEAPDRVSRVMVIPTERWEYSSTIKVPAGQTITSNVTLAAKPNMRLAQAQNAQVQVTRQARAIRPMSGSLSIRTEKLAIVAATFTVSGGGTAQTATLDNRIVARPAVAQNGK